MHKKNSIRASGCGLTTICCGKNRDTVDQPAKKKPASRPVFQCQRTGTADQAGTGTRPVATTATLVTITSADSHTLTLKRQYRHRMHFLVICFNPYIDRWISKVAGTIPVEPRVGSVPGWGAAIVRRGDFI
jgi:hypothetical protein